MVNIMMGPEGSGKTKQLIGALNQAVQREAGSIVCIEKGDTLRFDVDHKVRLIDIKDYAYGGYPFLRGFISGLHAGNFDITHIFMDNLYKLAQSSDPKETENFLDWCSVFSAENSVAFTLTIAGEAAEAPEYIARYMD
jgi:energy-coupling factor transporter ATP-binding protein EcfA2